MAETREQAQVQYDEIKKELEVLYERSRKALHPLLIAGYEAQISYKETELATILHNPRLTPAR